MVPRDEQRQIRRNLKEYSREFEEEDLARATGASQELLNLRRRLLEEWYAWRKNIEEALASERLDQREGVEESGEDEVIEEWVEEVVDEKEEVVTE
jgi:translation initiation factor 3 subunit B